MGPDNTQPPLLAIDELCVKSFNFHYIQNLNHASKGTSTLYENGENKGS